MTSTPPPPVVVSSDQHNPDIVTSEPGSMPATPSQSAFGPEILSVSLLPDDGSKRTFTLNPARVALFRNTAYLQDADDEIVAVFKTELPKAAKMLIATSSLIFMGEVAMRSVKADITSAEHSDALTGVTNSVLDGLSRLSEPRAMSTMMMRFVRDVVKVGKSPFGIATSAVLAVMINTFQSKMFMHDIDTNVHMSAKWRRARQGFTITYKSPGSENVRVKWILSVDPDSKEWKLSTLDFHDQKHDKSAVALEETATELREDAIDSSSQRTVSESKSHEQHQAPREALYYRMLPKLQREGVAGEGFDSGNKEQARMLDELAAEEIGSVLASSASVLEDGVVLSGPEQALSVPIAGVGSEEAPSEPPQDDGDRMQPTGQGPSVNLAIPLHLRNGDRILDATQNFMLHVIRSNVHSVTFGSFVTFQTTLVGADERYKLDFEGDTAAPRDVLAFTSYIARTSKTMPLSILIITAMILGIPHLIWALFDVILGVLSDKNLSWSDSLTESLQIPLQKVNTPFKNIAAIVEPEEFKEGPEEEKHPETRTEEEEKKESK